MLNRVVHRLKQFIFALKSRMTEDDRNFTRKYLKISEAALFDQLPEDIQKHSVMVARRALEIFMGHRYKIDERTLVRASLLHDVGKGLSRMGILDRTFLVMLRGAFPVLYDRLAAGGGRAGVHRDHAELAVELLRKAGVEEEVIEAVKGHNRPAAEGDSNELMILRKIDEGEI